MAETRENASQPTTLACSARRSGSTGRSPFDVDQFRVGMNVELEHGLRDERTNVSNDDPHVTAKIALAHLNEFADYYTRLERMEEEAKHDWAAM